MKKFISIITAMIMCVSFICCGFDISSTLMITNAASVDYPAQFINIATKNNSLVLAENGTTDGSSLTVKKLDGTHSATWRFDRVGVNSVGTFFKITNGESGRLITPDNYNVTDGSSVIMFGSESHQCQHWFVVPVMQDRLKNDLYYKIVNYSDPELAITQGSDGMTLQKYTGADSQLWLLNADGLQGFAGYCFDDNTKNIKAGNIGGLFGEVVEVTTFDDLKKYAESDAPYTIIVKENIGVTTLKMDSQNHFYCPDGRIYVRSNKTIVGSYGKHTLSNVQFCTASNKGVGNNIIIRNFEMKHDAKSNGNDSIVVYFGSGQNLWVDHVTFVGHNAVNTQGENVPDWDKFLACCYDADYCTVSDCSFGLHEYGLILGYPDDTEDSYKNKNNFPRMSIIGNEFSDTLTRAPGLMRYGYFHSLNNFVYNFSMAYTVHSDCKLFAEGCYYDGASTKGNVVCDWNEVTHPGAFADLGSKGVNCHRLGIEGSAKVCNWRPASNYAYKALSADDAKNYCTYNSGCKNSNKDMMYIRYSAPGMPSAGFTALPDGEMKPAAPSYETFENGSLFRFKNVNSGLYMQVENAQAQNGSNVHQWGTAENYIHDVWKLIEAENGYYYIATALDENSTFVLDVEAKKSDNGANIALYTQNGGDNQQFRFVKNEDNSYKILTKISGNKSAVEVISALMDSGANVQQWKVNGASCQNWIAELVSPESLTTTTTITTTTTATTTTTTVTTTVPITTTTPLSPVKYGDANCDGIVSIADAAAIFQYIANPDKYSISSQGMKNADVNGKSGITPDDAICIQMFDAGLLPSLPVE